MKRVLLFLSTVLAIVLGDPVGPDTDNAKGQIWAVLVAGSNTYDNYRHQADVCHAYQIFHRHGVPDSNIIVMMYDDIAHNSQNPNKGVIINKPGGPNVYGPKKVPKDYIKNAVNPKNFVHVLTGNKAALEGEGSGKVLKSGPNDHVFVNFVDHGSTGMIGFPNSFMYADDLIQTLKTMFKQKMFKKLVFYMEACESGSMFNKILPKNINIFATTAANPSESSYACYWDDHLQTYLGDEYSVAWMEDIDSEEHHKNLTTETLLKQFDNVVKRVADSHPSMYGQLAIDKDHVADYIGGNNKSVTFHSESKTPTALFQDAVSSRDVALHTLNKKIQLSNNADERKILGIKRKELIKGRKIIDHLFVSILSSLTIADVQEVKNSHFPLTLEMMPCYRLLVDSFTKYCVNIITNTYALGHMYKFANLCAVEASTHNVLKVFSTKCNTQHRDLVGIN